MWYENLKYYCKNCKNYNCLLYFRENNKHFWKKCIRCGFEKRKEIVFAEYKHEDGKVFLKSNLYKKWTQVELKKVKKGIKVMPV